MFSNSFGEEIYNNTTKKMSRLVETNFRTLDRTKGAIMTTHFFKKIVAKHAFHSQRNLF